LSVKIRLPDADRERLGAPEELDCDITVFTVREAEAIEDATGLTAEQALVLMNPVREPIDDDRIRIRIKPKGVRLRVWLGLYRADVAVAFDDLGDLDFWAFAGSHIVGAEPVRPGKENPSPVGEPATPSTSRTSGRTRSKRSQTST
jgi:hypothetical protein